MFIPIRTDYRMTRRPWVNYALIAANIALFVFGYGGGNKAIRPWLLDPNSPQLAQFFTSVFLHADLMHLLGNMLFLWVFGNALNDRFGHLAYLAFYLAGGVLAGVGYMLLAGRVPVLGASGAISAVTGAYLVLFPRVRVTVLVFLYFITTWQVSSVFFVGFQVVYNLLMTLAGTGGGVAYTAHSSGYVFGMLVAAGLLLARVLPRDEMDLLSLVGHSQRRQRYRRMVSQGYDPFQGTGPGRPAVQAPRRGRWVETKTVESARPGTQAARELELRRDISAACSRHDLAAAAGKYLQLVQIADGAVLSRQNQLDVANQLMSAEQYPAAADAYERFLRQYYAYEHVGDIHLMLGLLYGRYLHQYDQAELNLSRAIEALHDERKIGMARNELQAVRHRRGS
ncbi:MAG TPA: rhomboid family intramembrane serine protease [Phycisphaerae bacterium]|nr:rhomboid family intramembrane serine protease [Phycisphaerae bacterium]